MQVSNTKIGAITFWSLCATKLSALKKGLTDLGLASFCPDQPTQMGALREALEKTFPGKMIRRLRKHGYTVVDETVGDDDNDFETVASAKFVYEGQEGESVKTKLIIRASLADEMAIRDAFDAAQDVLPAVQVGTILADVCDHLLGTTLRPSGGVYWLSHKVLPTWEAVGRAVEAAAVPPKGRESSAVYVIKHDMDAAAVRAVRDAIVKEMTHEAARLTREIESGEFGEKAIASRKAEAVSLLGKVAEYEGLLNTGLENIRKVLADVETAQAVVEFKEVAVTGAMTEGMPRMAALTV